MSTPCKCCLLSAKGLCVGLITRPEESYRLRCVWVWSWSLDNDAALLHHELSCHEKTSIWHCTSFYQMKYTFTDSLHNVSQVVVHDRHMILNLEPSNKRKTQMFAFDCRNVITRKQTSSGQDWYWSSVMYSRFCSSWVLNRTSKVCSDHATNENNCLFGHSSESQLHITVRWLLVTVNCPTLWQSPCCFANAPTIFALQLHYWLRTPVPTD